MCDIDEYWLVRKSSTESMRNIGCYCTPYKRSPLTCTEYFVIYGADPLQITPVSTTASKGSSRRPFLVDDMKWA